MSQVLTVCIFCGHEVSEDAISCAGCKEYKGITKATECASCGDLVPLGQHCNCQPPPLKIISPGKCDFCETEHKGLICGVCINCWRERVNWYYLDGALDFLDISAKSLVSARERFTKEDRPGAPDKDGLYTCRECNERQEGKMMANWDMCIDCLPDPTP